MQGQNNLDQLLANWSDYEVATAARGAVGGSAALVAANRKAKAVQYAGSDLSLAGDDGVYGTSLAALKSNLLQERRQAELQHETDIRQLDINKASADAARAAYKSAAERKGELYDKYKGFAGLDEDARATELYGQKKQALDEEYKQLYPRGVKWYKLGRV